MSGILEKESVKSDDFDLRNFYKQWWTIEQLVDSFWDILIDSCKKQIDRQNFESVENVRKAYELFINSKNKTRNDCVEECKVENIDRDLDSCIIQALVQAFCREKELHLERINNYSIDFLDFSAIDIKEPHEKSLSNKQIIREIRGGITHKHCMILPEWVYIDNPKWPNHLIHFRAIVKTSFLLSFVGELYSNIENCYVKDVDCRTVDFHAWFHDNADKISVVESSFLFDPKNDWWLEKVKITQGKLLVVYDLCGIGKSFHTEKEWMKKIRSLTAWEIKLLSEFFDNHFWGEPELRLCLLERDDLCDYVILILALFKHFSWTYEDFLNSRGVRKILDLQHMSKEEWWDQEIVWELKEKYHENNNVWLLPNYVELRDILIHLIRDIFNENKRLLDRNPEDRRLYVLELVKARFKQCIDEYLSSEKYYRERKKELEMKKIEDEIIYDLLNHSEIVVKKEENLGEDDFIVHTKDLEDWTIECYCVKDEKRCDEMSKSWTDIEKEAISRISSMNVHDYKDEIQFWEKLPYEQKENYLNMMENDIMKIFDRAFSNINYQEIKLKMGIEYVPNYLKALNISNYYINDPSFNPVRKWDPIPEREHIRNSSAHINSRVLPWTNKILLQDPSQKKGIKDWESVYNLRSLHWRCARKIDKRFK